MAQKGRPKNITKAKNRIHSVVLTEKAKIIYDEIKRKRSKFNLNEYVSSHLVRDFENGSAAFALWNLHKAQERVKEAELEVYKCAEELARIKRQKEANEIKKRIEESKEIIGVR